MRNLVHYLRRINRVVKIPSHKTFYLLIIAFYLISLFPLAKVTIKSESDDLREAVHTLQVLQANTSETTQKFKKSLQYSIKTIQNLAGLQTTIFVNDPPNENKPSSLITITFRSPYLPANSYSLPPCISEIRFSFPEHYDFYLSLNFAPETPPPVHA